jgi:hypothetical protein
MSRGPDPNPYQSPASYGGSYDAGAAGGVVTAKTVEMLRQTQPWVRFLSVLGFIGTALMILAGLFGLLGAAMGGSAELGVMMVAYLLVGLLYFIPTMYLSRYATAINRFRQGLHVAEMETALEAQKSFWKFVGIVTLVILALYVVLILVAIAGGVAFLRMGIR